MNTKLTLGALLLLAALGASAQAPLTRDQVKTEHADAIRSGNMPATRDSSPMLNDVLPGRYQSGPVAIGKTREQVKAELAEAIRTGDMPAGESSLMLYELYPGSYAKARETLYANQPQQQMAPAAAASAPTYAR